MVRIVGGVSQQAAAIGKRNGTETDGRGREECLRGDRVADQKQLTGGSGVVRPSKDIQGLDVKAGKRQSTVNLPDKLCSVRAGGQGVRDGRSTLYCRDMQPATNCPWRIGLWAVDRCRGS